MSDILANRPKDMILDDREVVTPEATADTPLDIAQLEPIRRQLLAFEPQQFEHVIHDLLEQSGFEQVEVTNTVKTGVLTSMRDLESGRGHYVIS